MKNILLIAGHGKSPSGSYDPGACSSWGQEADFTRELATMVQERLNGKAKATMYPQNQDCYAYSRAGNAPDYSKYDYVLEIHFNAKTSKDPSGDGYFTGTGGYIHPNDPMKDVANAIVNNIVSKGFKLWMIDQSTGLLNLNRVRSAGKGYFLLETAFIDDGDDMAWYTTHKADVADAIVAGLTESQNDEPTDSIWMGWTVRETGSAGLRCVHGDAGRAYGLQFDYRYGLVPFMQACVNYNYDRYCGFNYYIQLGAGNSALVSNEALGVLWQGLYDTYTEEFSQLQLTQAYESYYKEASRYMKNLYGIDMAKRSPALKGTLFSMAFRSGALTGARKFAGCSASDSDQALIDRAYAAYGSEDSGRWQKKNQWGDANTALSKGTATTVYTSLAALKESVAAAEEPKKQEETTVAEEKRVNYKVQIIIPDGVDYTIKGRAIQFGSYSEKKNANNRLKAIKALKLSPQIVEEPR